MVLQGKRILIVGASRGIGEAIAGAFVREGAEIVITGRNEETLSAVCARINAEREAARFFAWDVSDVKKAPESVLKSPRRARRCRQQRRRDREGAVSDGDGGRLGSDL